MAMGGGAGAAASARGAPVCSPAERATASRSGLSPLPWRNEDAVIGGFLRSTGHDAIDDGATRWGAGAMSLCHRAVATVSWNKTRSEEHTSELQSLMRSSYAVFCLKKKTTHHVKPPIHGSI